MKTRKEITSFISKWIDEILPDGFNKERIEKILNSKTDKEFIDYIKGLGDGRERLSLIAPNGAKVKLDIKRNLEIAKKLNLSFFERIYLKTPDGKGEYLTHDKYLVIDLPVRRQSQLLIKKASIPQDNKTIDSLTGQPAGERSKGSKISFPEVQMMASLSLNHSLGEFMKYRGGDRKGFHALNTLISRNGRVSQKAAEPFSGKVRSTETLYAFLTGMHLQNNL